MQSLFMRLRANRSRRLPIIGAARARASFFTKRGRRNSTAAVMTTLPAHEPHDPAAPRPPSAWVRRWAAYIPAGGRVLDVAAGSGRHTRLLAELGHAVEAVDRDAAAMARSRTWSACERASRTSRRARGRMQASNSRA